MPGRFVLVLLVALALPWSARAQQAVGSVSRLQGHVVAVASGISRNLAVGAAVDRGDTLRTGDRARIEVHFADGTTLVLGEDAVLAVERYAFDAGAKSGDALLNLERGPFLLDSGALAKLPGRPLHIKTPVASIGLRGTRFWGGPLDETYNVLLFEGAVMVTNAAGSVELVTPGAGTSTARPDQPPSPPLQWSDERIRRAVATVSFER